MLKSKLNIVYLVSLATVFFVAIGTVPREAVFFLLGLQVFYIIFSPLEDGVSLFVRLVPFFIALPISESFDNFNSWRLISLVIFVKWLIEKSIMGKLARYNFSIRELWTHHRLAALIFLLFILAAASLFKAIYLFIGIKKIIYFVNLLLVPIVVGNLVRSSNYLQQIKKDVVAAASSVIIIGLLQQLSTHLLSFADFIDLWAKKVQFNFYGHEWAEIAISANTWFAYNMSESLRLRVFSTFPDSHSFPLFLLASLPFIYAFWLKTNADKNNGGVIRIILTIVYFFLFFLVIVLSGTRGIWASFIFPLIFLFYEVIAAKNQAEKNISRKILLSLTLFFVAFGSAYIILQKSQFMLKESASEERANIIKRVSSIIDTGETSNAGRIQIWQKTIDSFKRNPLLGVGIGNFPLVLKERIETARAGASAHNLYLNIGAEMGILAMLIFIWLFWEILIKTYQLVRSSSATVELKILGLSALVSLLWICGYNLTDAALFDERAFLMFGTMTAVVCGLSKKEKTSN